MGLPTVWAKEKEMPGQPLHWRTTYQSGGSKVQGSKTTDLQKRDRMVAASEKKKTFEESCGQRPKQ